jgi:hypothetical protein
MAITIPDTVITTVRLVRTIRTTVNAIVTAPHHIRRPLAPLSAVIILVLLVTMDNERMLQAATSTGATDEQLEN